MYVIFSWAGFSGTCKQAAKAPTGSAAFLGTQNHRLDQLFSPFPHQTPLLVSFSPAVSASSVCFAFGERRFIFDSFFSRQKSVFLSLTRLTIISLSGSVVTHTEFTHDDVPN